MVQQFQEILKCSLGQVQLETMLVNSAVFRYDLKEALGSDWKQECNEVIESLNEQRNSPVHTF